ncbi:dicarboxylate/amino acid:cation symporter [Rhodohalobacter sulfatireducens]|uniref:Dicarboxylate/amino acid:cation symporter n=1 Tax=Rhodohalobacter sulfatireducens TaxID=2911366 RepID=A0ABS9KB15_9BACT|nr:dicarboxylate/amino acid:cation symporter [Rhodohalobacter sulfatireducens]MCG2588047.1 dicarboxylate/amino acid:cation symporter [Rhodohalobacter sulfatireducens]
MKWYRKLHWQIIIGLILGLIWGLLSSIAGFNEFTSNYVRPFGDIFITLLKLIAVPLVLASLVVGVTSLNDMTKLSRMGGKTIGIYMVTTVFAITIGLTSVNIIQPGKTLPEETRTSLMESYGEGVQERGDAADQLLEQSPLQFIVDIVPENFFAAASDNGNMLQIVFVAVLLGIGIVQIPLQKSQVLINVFEALNDVIIKIVDLIMKLAPYGVFALMAVVIIDLAGDDIGQALVLLKALGWYCITVVIGLLIHVIVVYSSLFKIFSKMKLRDFFRAIQPAVLLGFSTSSSVATLPVTMERVEKNLGVEDEVSSFVLPVGATINMDGTSLYQAVAAVFIAQALGLDLSIAQQLTIVLTATLASIGAAGVPGAGIIMLVIVLQAVQVPLEGIALILGVDRILDMLRTAVNVTGDAAVSVAVAYTEGKLGPLHFDDDES